MAFVKTVLKEFDPYTIIREDQYNWVLYVKQTSTNKDGVESEKDQRLSYNPTLVFALQDIAQHMADSAHVVTVQEYVNEITAAFAKFEKFAPPQVDAPVKQKRTRSSKVPTFIPPPVYQSSTPKPKPITAKDIVAAAMLPEE